MLNFEGCGKGADPWVEKYFRDCVYDVRDGVGFGLGLCSIFVWLTAQIPQFISNIKNQSSEALSIWFLVEWFAGDTLNLLGCLIQGQQLPTTTILAAYFVLMDVFMLLQYIYYGALQARKRRLRAKAAQRKRHAGHHHHHHSKDSPQRHGARRAPDGSKAALLRLPGADPTDSDGTPGFTPAFTPTCASESGASPVAPGGGAPGAGNWRTTAVAAAAGMSLVCAATLVLRPATAPPLGGTTAAWPQSRRHLLLAGPDAVAAAAMLPSHLSGDGGVGGWGLDGWPLSKKHDGSGGCSFLNCDVALVAGTVMGYLSTCFYLASRISQIRKNLERNSTEGLSPVMFMLTISANLCTGVSIVMRLRTVEQLKDQLPWMCGTFGTIALDVTLFYQALTLGQHGAHGGHGSHGAHGGHSAGGHGHHHHHHHHRHGGSGGGSSACTTTHGSVGQLSNGLGSRATLGAGGSDGGGGGCSGGPAAGGKARSDLEAPLLEPDDG